MSKLNNKLSNTLLTNPVNLFWRRFGRSIFYLAWPGIWLIVRLSRGRTRVFIVHQNHVLLVKDWLGSGKWKLPGGGLHRGEEIKDCAMRETKEEVGINLSPKQLFHLAEFKTTSNSISTNIYAFKVNLENRPTIRVQANEISDYCWCDLNDIDEKKLSLTTQIVLKHFRQTP